jgi:hypothetical protein
LKYALPPLGHGKGISALTLESLIPDAFLALAMAGFKKNLWLIVAALAGHGVFDFYHHLSSVPTLFEQNQLITCIGEDCVLDRAVK